MVVPEVTTGLHRVVYATGAPQPSLLVRLEDVAYVMVPSAVHVTLAHVRPIVIHLPTTIPRRPVAIILIVAVAVLAVVVAPVAVALAAVAALAPVAVVVTSVADAKSSMRVEPDS